MQPAPAEDLQWPGPRGVHRPVRDHLHHQVQRHQGLEQLIISTCYLCSRQVEASPGKKVAETKCEQLPVNICGAGCFTQEAEQEECEDEEVISSAS